MPAPATETARQRVNAPGPAKEIEPPVQDQDIPIGRCQCGCGEPTNPARITDPRLGYVKGEPMAYLRGHNNGGGRQYKVDDATGCWVWQRKRGKNGYGVLQRGNKSVYAHRWMFEREVGPLGDRQIHHKCHNRLCVNPDHLEPITRERHAQLHSKGRYVSDEDVRAIREADGTWTEIAERFGVSPSYVYNVCLGVYRKEAGGPLVTRESLFRPRRCDVCGADFKPGRVTQRYCQTRCARRAEYLRSRNPGYDEQQEAA